MSYRTFGCRPDVRQREAEVCEASTSTSAFLPFLLLRLLFGRPHHHGKLLEGLLLEG